MSGLVGNNHLGLVGISDLKSTIVTGTRTTGEGTGDETVTGAGFTPTSCIIFHGNQHTEYGGVGWADDAAVDGNWSRNALKWVIGTGFVVMDNNGTAAMVSVLTSFDADGCTMAFTKYGAGVLVDYSILFFR
jgi:hypothetical protein